MFNPGREEKSVLGSFAGMLMRITSTHYSNFVMYNNLMHSNFRSPVTVGIMPHFPTKNGRRNSINSWYISSILLNVLKIYVHFYYTREKKKHIARLVFE